MPVIARGPPALGLREKPPQVATTRPGYVEPMGLGREDHARAATLRRLVAGAQHVRFASQTITTLLSSTVSVRKHREHAKMAVADADAPYSLQSGNPKGSCCEWFGHSVYKSDILRCNLAGSAVLLERF